MEANQSSPKKRNCYKTLVLENIKYKTRFTAKFSNRKKYEPRNPKKLTAFIPGLIKDITVKAGSKVKENDKLLVLEAMKMNNHILAPMDGVVKAVYVKNGDAVPKEGLLIEMK